MSEGIELMQTSGTQILCKYRYLISTQKKKIFHNGHNFRVQMHKVFLSGPDYKNIMRKNLLVFKVETDTFMSRMI